MCTQFNCQKYFYFKLFSLVKKFYFKQFSSDLIYSFDVKTVLFQAVQFSISKQFNGQKYLYFKQYSLIKQF